MANAPMAKMAAFRSTPPLAAAFAITSKDSKDAMLLITLPPGGYTAQATPSTGAGATGGGLVIVEVYEVP